METLEAAERYHGSGVDAPSSRADAAAGESAGESRVNYTVQVAVGNPRTGEIATQLVPLLVGSVSPPSTWLGHAPNLPILSDHNFTTLTGQGWSSDYPPDAGMTLSTDPTAPVSPPNVARFFYGKGNGNLCGAAPGTLSLTFPGVTKLYIAVSAKFSSTFAFPGDPGPSGEVHFLYGNPQSNAWAVVDMKKDGGVEFIGAGFDKWSTSGLYQLGQWTMVELLMDYVAKTAQCWVNGTPAFASPTPAAYSGGGFTKVQISPTWGGCTPPDSPARDGILLYDHVQVRGA